MPTTCLLLDGNKPALEDDLYEFPHGLVVKWFKNGRYGRIGTIGDGSCFFHSVSRALDYQNYSDKDETGRKKIARALRKALSEAFTTEDYSEIEQTLVTTNKKSYEDIKRMLSEPSTWAEEIMIKWSSKYLGLNIIFLNIGNNTNEMYCGVHDRRTAESIKRCENPQLPTVIVAWVDHSHFELVVRIDNVTDDHVVIRKYFDPDVPKDLETIQQVMRAYTKKCKV
jgi:hypothetical protein